MSFLSSEKKTPQWFENNVLFRKLFLWRKVFLTNHRKSHYSQFGEDISVRLKFPEDYRGFFVDVGCYHPVKMNNTWALYRRGWRGINIDIDKIKIEAFDLRRKEDVNIAACVSDRKGPLKFYRRGFYSLMNSVDQDFGQKHGEFVEEVPCRTLTSIIDETRYKDCPIDFLSVDAEGHDLSVIRSLDFDRYCPRLIAIESHEPTLKQVEATELYQTLCDRGYTMVAWCGFTLILASPEHQQQLGCAA